MGKIVAIGGGEMGRLKEDGKGFHPVETTSIDQEIIRLTGKKNPKLLFIPTASNDSTEYYDIVKDHFLKLGCSQVGVLNLSDKILASEQIKPMILSYDVIYVGGGNTLRMMLIWRKLGVDKVLKQAFDQGIVLSGISAGSICWFSHGSSDSRKFTSGSDKLIKVTGLGLINTLHCPHYNDGHTRQNNLKKMLKTTSKVGIALDDCAALEVIDGKYRVITSKPGAKAYKTYWKQGTYITEEISAHSSLAELSQLTQK